MARTTPTHPDTGRQPTTSRGTPQHPTAGPYRGPEHAPGGPWHDDDHHALKTWAYAIDGVAHTAFTIPSRQYNGPPILCLSATDTTAVATLLERVQAATEDLPIIASAATVERASNSPLAGRLTPQALPEPATVDIAVTIYQHPLAKLIDGALAAHDAVADYTLKWPVDVDGLSPLVPPSWADLAPVTASIELAGADLEDDTTAVQQAVRGAVVAVDPAAYVAAVDTTLLDADAAADVMVSVGFADNTDHADARSRVHAAPAEQVPSLLERTPGSTTVEADSAETGVQLTVTSPPYVDAIDYDAHASGTGDDWTAGSMSDDEVAAWMDHQRAIFEQVYEVTREGGYCAVVVGTITREDSGMMPLPHHFASVMQAAGWTFHERVIWDKTTSRGGRFGTTVQHPEPTYYYPNHQHEEIQIWRKGEVVHRDASSELAMTEVMKKEIANNVWHVPPVPHNKAVEHPCPFPEELVHRLTLLYSYEGDIVLDPMAGSGTTVTVADRLGRVGVGTELRREYVQVARERLATASYERRDQILPSFETVSVCQDESAAAGGDDSEQTVDESAGEREGAGAGVAGGQVGLGAFLDAGGGRAERSPGDD